MEKKPGPEFLKGKYDLHSAPEVDAAAERTKRRTGERVSQKPGERIQNYLDRFKEITEREDEGQRERGLEALDQVLHEKFVIKPEDVPESYFKKQQEIARELGHGDLEITEEMRRQHTEVIITDQKSSLDNWTHYLTSSDATYPDWLKYYAFRSVTGLGDYDKEKKKFTKRSKETVKPFPDLNREALAYALDAIEKKYKEEGQDLDDLGEKEREEFEKLLQDENFGKLYAWAIEKVTPESQEALTDTAGEWVKYDAGSDHMPLVESLQGHGTGWCTAGESTGQKQLATDDFYVYYSYDQNGKPTIPRSAIRMQGNSIAEVRGIAPEQNLDPYIGDVVKDKLAEFPDGKFYEKRVADMKYLTEIGKNQLQKKTLTVEDLRFLYEMDGRIDGFGYRKDPRIEEIKIKRDTKKDYALIFSCQPEQVALNLTELKANSTVFVGSLYFEKSQIRELPAGLTHVGGSLDLKGSQVKELPTELTHVGGNLDLRKSQVKELPAGLTHVGGSLDLKGSQVKELPAGLTHVGGHLDLEGSQIKDLPAGLTHVGGDLGLKGTRVKELPAGLTHVGGHLDLEGSQIKDLPAGLTHVGGHLDLRYSQINKLSAGLTHVGGHLDLNPSQIKELPAGLTHVGGHLNLGRSQVKELPAGLTHVGGHLDLEDSQVKELPAGLTHVGGNLNLRYSQVKELPAGLTHVGGCLDLRSSQVKELPEDIDTIVERRIFK